MKDQLFDPWHLLFSEDHVSQIMPSGPWEELDTPTYRIVLIFWGVYKVKRWRSREKHPLKLLSAQSI